MVGPVAGISGRLISSSFAEVLLPTLAGYGEIPPADARALEIVTRRGTALGPASSLRSIADTLVVPLLQALGFIVEQRIDEPRLSVIRLSAGTPGRFDCGALVIGYNQPLSSVWRESVRCGVSTDARWTLCSNGVGLRLIDSRRTWSRDYVEFDLLVLAENHLTQSALWSLARAEALAASVPLLDRAVALSARHGVEVCRALGDGVLEALQAVMAALAPRARRTFPSSVLFEHSLTVLYRILFLLFAEARGLVPLWHPIYRDRYSLDAIVGALLQGQPPRGLWRALQAIAHLAHSGCSAGELSVTAFNGRLFSPSQAAAFDRTRVEDSVLANAIVAVGTTAVGQTRARIAYRDLDVEQLGAVYERVLDYEPQSKGRDVSLVRSGDLRKATGSFYTPRAVTSYLVRRTLDPLIAGRSSDAILNLRILDPAMGSGAFLVAACRHLADAAEQALIREGQWHPHDITGSDRALLRRQIAARCLYGVDLNPMAAQLARLSLWLATLAANRPLSFLDHHLVVGNSLVGATADDVRRQPSRGRQRVRRADTLPLFDADGLCATVAGSIAVRLKLDTEPDDSAAVVREKERILTKLMADQSSLRRWLSVLDLWCAGWFWESGPAPDRHVFGELLSELLGGGSQLPSRVTGPLLEQAQRIASRHQFFHWPLIFSEVFCDREGLPRTAGGFDAVISNPPWDMVRGDSGDEGARLERRTDAQRLTAFVRESGIYRVGTRAHANRYQLFVERALQLVRPGGRIGLVLPAGLISDTGTAPLRRFLFERAAVDELAGFDNREAIFPIHRSVRFVLLSCTAGQSTNTIRCRFGISRVDALERVDDDDNAGVTLTRNFLSRLSGSDDLGIPDLHGEIDLRILERISEAYPRLSSADGWNVQFGRELNATDDRHRFEPFVAAHTARPVVEGKQIDPFRVYIDRSRHQLRANTADRVPRRLRLAYRDVASATNRLTLIAALIPPRAVTTHTLFCLKTPTPADVQYALCGLLNSYVANYLVRLRVNTHVTASLVSRLPVPVIGRGDPAFERLSGLVRALISASTSAEEMDEYAELQALAAQLYGLSSREFEHVLSTFPLVSTSVRSRVLSSFNHLQ